MYVFSILCSLHHSVVQLASSPAALLLGLAIGAICNNAGTAHLHNHSAGCITVRQLSGKTSCLIAILYCLQTPAAFVSKFKSAATFSTKSCQLSVNTTDYFSKMLYSGGEDVTYSSVQDFMSALTDGSFALGMLPNQTFVPVITHFCYFAALPAV